MAIRGMVVLAMVGCGVVGAYAIRGQQTQPASEPSYEYFFTEMNQAFEASMDRAHMTLDANGDKLVSVKLSKFSASFRDWIKSNFPGGEMADYAVDSYSIDCEAKTVGEHQIVWYDANGGDLADYDFGGNMSAPIIYSMKDNLMKKVCGLQ